MLRILPVNTETEKKPYTTELTTDLHETALSQDEKRELYEHAPCGYLLTQEDGLIVNSNRTFLLWAGYTHEELIQKYRFQDLLTVPGKIYYETHFAPLMKIQGVVREVAFDLQRRNSPPLSVLVTSVRRQYHDQAPVEYRYTVFDATARRQYERQLLEQKRKLAQLNDEKNELLGMAAHELRTPLGVISTYSEFLQDEAGPVLSQEHQDFLALIRSTSNYMLRLINDILDVSQIEAGKLHLEKELTDLESLVQDTLAMHRQLAERKQIREVLSCPPDLPRLMLDPMKISQVLDNLLINAIKFSPSNTEITITLTYDETDLWLSVADQGRGIPAAHLKTIFKPFHQGQLENTQGEAGTGLGLSIVRRIVEGHGGQVKVVSQEHQGTEFSIRLPLNAG